VVTWQTAALSMRDRLPLTAGIRPAQLLMLLLRDGHGVETIRG